MHPVFVDAVKALVPMIKIPKFFKKKSDKKDLLKSNEEWDAAGPSKFGEWEGKEESNEPKQYTSTKSKMKTTPNKNTQTIENLNKILKEEVGLGFETDLTITECQTILKQQDAETSIIKIRLDYAKNYKIIDKVVQIVNTIRDLCDQNVFVGYWLTKPTISLVEETANAYCIPLITTNGSVPPPSKKYVHSLQVSFLIPNFSFVPFMLIMEKNGMWTTPGMIVTFRSGLSKEVEINCHKQVEKFDKFYKKYMGEEEVEVHIKNDLIDIEEHTVKAKSKRKIKV